RTAELAHLAGDHVHAHAAAGQAADLAGGGEARLEDQRVHIAVGERGPRPDQATFLGAAADRGAVQAGAVVAHLQHHFRPLAAHRDADRALLALAGPAALVGRFDAVRDR